MSVEHFVESQRKEYAGFSQALREMEAGRKTSHWIWYIFPQIHGLGRSPIAQKFALGGRHHAIDFLMNQELKSNLIAITAVVARQLKAGIPLGTLMGSNIDALKLVSSITLFESVIQLIKLDGDIEYEEFLKDCQTILSFAELQGYPRCQHTLGLLG